MLERLSSAKALDCAGRFGGTEEVALLALGLLAAGFADEGVADLFETGSLSLELTFLVSSLRGFLAAFDDLANPSRAGGSCRS